MRLFSNFDTELDKKLYKEFIEKYGKDKVLLIYRDKIFFIFHVLIPAFIYIFLMLFLAYIVYVLNFSHFKWWIYLLIFLVSFIIVGWKLLKRFIDYKMDFAIITPNEIMAYNQTGFFTRQARTIDVEKLKTISVDKKGILQSIFNYGTLIFLSEGDDHGQGGIELYYVSDPDETKKKVLNIVKFGIEELDK